MVSMINDGDIDQVKEWAKGDFGVQEDDGTMYLRTAVIGKNSICLVNLLIQVGFQDNGFALTSACMERNLSCAHLLLQHFGDRKGYVDNQTGKMGSSGYRKSAHQDGQASFGLRSGRGVQD